MNASHYKTRRLTAVAVLMTGLLGSGASWAVLQDGSTLNIGAGSNFTMSGMPTPITGLNGIVLGTTQPASGSHSGAPGCVNGVGTCNNTGESPNIDNPWGFFGNTGMDQTTSPSNVLTASGNTATVDLSGWNVTWNGIPSISMGSGAWGTNAAGVADIVCGVDCGNGDTYTLTYTATVPAGDPSGFGGVQYGLNLIGTISVPVPPVASNLSLSVAQNTVASWTPDVTDDNGDTLTCSIVAQPTAGQGTATVAADCSTGSYDPDAFVGSTSFTYLANDGTADSNAATVTVTVAATPPPVAADDTATTRVNTPVDINVTANDTDADGTVDVTTVVIVLDVTNGTTSVDAVTGVVTYTPNASFTGPDSFTYTVDDNDSQTSDPATVTITVTPNSVPTASNDSATTDADTAVVINVLANDSDSDGTLDPATVTASNGTHGTTNVNATTGQITYTPNPSFVGLDTFTYTVDDNDGGTSNSATVTVTVRAAGAGAMPPNATLSIDAGSNFTMEVSPGFHLPTAITGFQGLKTFVAQAASGSHTNSPGTVAGENPGVDNPWGFFGNTGMHGTTTPARVLSATGNTATLDMSGWFVTWNGIALIPMSNNPWGSNAEGVADIVCGVDCGDGDTYTLTYTATVPVGDPSGFGGVAYGLNLVGTINVIPVVDASGSTGTPVVGDGSEGGTEASGYQIAVTGLSDDPDYDAVSSVFDFSVSGLGVGGTAVVTLNLGQAMPAGAVYRKFTHTSGWFTFDTSAGDTIESGASVSGDCATAAGVTYAAGLAAGNDCIRLTITDGGSNDGDRSLNGTVFDPGVVAVPAAAPFVDTRTSGSSNSGGCTLATRPASVAKAGDWLLVGLALVGLALFRRRAA